MSKLKKAIMILILPLILTCSSCTEKINGVDDEIRSYKWITQNSESNASLRFENENAVLDIHNYDENCTIEGLCIISDSKLVIIDNSLNKKFIFGYSLSGNALTMEYLGNSIEFFKTDS